MRIAICGSMNFAREMIETKEELEKIGHQVVIPTRTEQHAKGQITEQDKWEKLNFDVFKKYFDEIKTKDAILVLNKSKNNISGYIGGNSLIEMGFAHVLNKKIFLFNKIPQLSYTEEIKAMNPIIINENLKLITN